MEIERDRETDREIASRDSFKDRYIHVCLKYVELKYVFPRAEPLLARIKENNRILVTPLIDMVHPNNMQYMKSGVFYQSFSWNLEYVWRSLPKGVTHNPIDPLPYVYRDS